MGKDIYELHEMLEEYIRNNIFSSNLIRKLSFQFQRLLHYMDEHSTSLYTKELEDQYLKFRSLPINNRRKKETSFNMEARYITLLNGMLEDKWIIKVSRKNLKIPLPGSLGDYCMNFLEKYATARRLNIKAKNNYYNSLYKFCERMEFDHVTSLSDITAEKVLDFVASSQNCKDQLQLSL